MYKLLVFLLGILFNLTNEVKIESSVGLVSIAKVSKPIYCASNSPKILNVLHNDINKLVIKEVSGLLPKADIISKKVLEWNDIWIERTLDSRIIPEDFKKSIILSLINIVETGDGAGSDFLHWYHSLVDCLLP